jgi:predicted transcriptional regulator
MFLSANRHAPSDQVRGQASPEHALARKIIRSRRACFRAACDEYLQLQSKRAAAAFAGGRQAARGVVSEP